MSDSRCITRPFIIDVHDVNSSFHLTHACRSLPSRNTFCARVTESMFPDLVGPLVLAGMNSDVMPDFTLPRFYVANLIEGMRKRLEVSNRTFCAPLRLRLATLLASTAIFSHCAVIHACRMCNGWMPLLKQRRCGRSMRLLPRSGCRTPLSTTGKCDARRVALVAIK